MGKLKNWLHDVLFGKTYQRELHRDAGSGKFVSDERVKESPDTTTTEIREVKKRKKKS